MCARRTYHRAGRGKRETKEMPIRISCGNSCIIENQWRHAKGMAKNHGENCHWSWGGFWEGLGGTFEHSGLFLAALRKIFAGAVCCLLLLSWSLSSKSVLAFACCCLPGHVFASRSTELILNLNSCWLCCLLLLSFACFGLLWLALACFGCFGCAFRSIAA